LIFVSSFGVRSLQMILARVSFIRWSK